ncbi:hypothetical protein HQ576_10005 [bacterium]|nr:hypothetical protein [bacterium]
MSTPLTEADLRRWRRRLIAIVAMALALVAAILLLGHRSSTATEQLALNEFGQRQLILAQEAARGIQFYFRLLGTSLRALAEDTQIRSLEEGPTRRMLELKVQELRTLGVWDVGVVDAAGVLRYSGNDRDKEGTDLSSRSYFRKAREADSSDVSIVDFVDLEGITKAGKGVIVGIPMLLHDTDRSARRAPSRFVGLVACVVKLDFMAQEFVAPLRAAPGGHAFLIDGDGAVLWSRDTSRVGRSVLAGAAREGGFDAMVARMRAGETGTAEYERAQLDASPERTSVVTETHLAAFHPVRVTQKPWSIVVWTPRATALRLSRSARRTHHLIIALSTAVVLAGAALALVLCSRLRGLLAREVERKTKQLAASRERLLTVLDGLDALVYAADLETGAVLFANERMRGLYGDAIGRDPWDVLHVDPEQTEAHGSVDVLLDEQDEPTGAEAWEYQCGVHHRWYAARDRAIRWVDGRMVRLEIAVDITLRREQEQRIERSRQELTAATSKVAELIETAAREQTGDTHFDNPNLVPCWEVRACGNTWCPCHGKTGLRCWQVEGTYCDSGEPEAFADKVLQCRSCEVFRQSCPDRLTELAEGFNNMMHLLSRKAEETRQLRFQALQRDRMATIGQMAAGIAHEIDNPIASLFSLVQLLKMADLDDESKARIALMQTCIERVSKTVRQVVNFGRPVSDEEWSYGDLRKTVEDTVNLLRYDRRARKVDIQVDFEPGLPGTLIIEHQLQQVFMNIMVNALDAMQGKGKLTVCARQTDDALEVTISDTGEGMRPEQIQHIFEPFYTTKAGQKGTGLGLAMSYNTVQRHGGTIRVESNIGAGSAFTVSIPIRTPDGGEHASGKNPGR